jgi:hypothetical protein
VKWKKEGVTKKQISTKMLWSFFFNLQIDNTFLYHTVWDSLILLVFEGGSLRGIRSLRDPLDATKDFSECRYYVEKGESIETENIDVNVVTAGAEGQTSRPRSQLQVRGDLTRAKLAKEVQAHPPNNSWNKQEALMSLTQFQILLILG